MHFHICSYVAYMFLVHFCMRSDIFVYLHVFPNISVYFHVFFTFVGGGDGSKLCNSFCPHKVPRGMYLRFDLIRWPAGWMLRQSDIQTVIGSIHNIVVLQSAKFSIGNQTKSTSCVSYVLIQLAWTFRTRSSSPLAKSHMMKETLDKQC